MEIKEELFKDIIGQEKVKTRLRFELQSFEKTGVFDNILFTAPKGFGKTTLAKEISKGISNIKKDKYKTICPLIEINTSTFKKQSQFFDFLVFPHLTDKHAVVLFDEFHGLTEDVRNIMLSIIQPGQTVTNFNYNGESVKFDFSKITFLASTSEVQLIFPPLRNRLTEINVQEPTMLDLALIIRKNVVFHISPSVCVELATYCRENCRDAVGLAREINKYCQIREIKEFNKDHIKKLTGILNIYPQGVTETEISILKKLEMVNEISLGGLCSKTGLTRTAQMNFERYLLKLSFLEIPGKRKITNRGRLYLDNLKTLELIK